MASRGTGPGHDRVLGGQGSGSAATLPRRRLLAKCAFAQRFLANSPSRPGSARPRRGEVLPSGGTPPAGRGRRGPFTPLRCPGFGEGSPAVTNPQKSPRFLTRSFATGRGLNFWGLVTAHSRRRDSAADQPVRRRWGSASRRLCLGADSLVCRSPVTLVLGRWCRARSRRIEGPT